MMSESTEPSLRLAACRSLSMRATCEAFSRVSCLRVRVRSRSAWIAIGGTKLARMRPCASRSASQVASFTSVLRPGTFLTCIALASTSSNASARTAQTGFQYTPVAVAGEPARQALQLRRRRAERLDEALDALAVDHAGAGHDAVAVHVDAGAALMQDFHDPLLASGAAPARSPRCRTLGCVLRPWWAWRQYGVRVGLRVQLLCGLAAPSADRPLCRRRITS
jgi:hypothetical protein